MQRHASTTGADRPGARRRFEEKTLRTIRGREHGALAKAQVDGWEVVRQDTGKLQSTIGLRRPRTSTAMESFMDRMPVVGAVADAHRPIVLIGVFLVVLALIITPMALVTAGDTNEAGPTPAAPTEEPAAVGSPDEPSERADAGGEEEAAPPMEEEYTGPSYEIAKIDEDVVLGEQDEVWVYTDSLDVESPGLREHVKAMIADVAREHGTQDLSVHIVTDREVIAANVMTTGPDFTAEHGMDYYVETVQPKEPTAWVAMYTGGMDVDAAELSTAESAYTLDWWPSGDHESETWKPNMAG